MTENFDKDNLKSLGKGKGGPQKPEDMATGAAKDAAKKVGGEAGADAVQAGVAVGAALTGKWDTAIKNGLEVLRKRWMEVVLILCAIATGFTLQCIVVGIILIAPIAATIEAPGAFVGWINDNTVGQITGEEQGGRGGESLCPVVNTPPWSIDALKESGTIITKDKDGKVISKKLGNEKKEGGCYGSLLKKAAQKTGIPWEIIAAIDFRTIEDAGVQGCYDCFTAGEGGKLEQAGPISGEPGRLEKIGNNLQIANSWRKNNGGLTPDSDGNIQHTIDPNGKYLVGEAQIFIQNYHCLNIKNSDDTWCFTDKYKGERYDFYTKDHWLWDGFDAEGYKDRLGVLGWYKNQTDKNKGCSFDELFRDPNAQPSPGAQLSKVPLFSQCDPKWAVDYAGGKLCGWGCGPTSLAMVLAYYGQDTNPAKVAGEATAVGGASSVGSKWSIFTDVPSKYYGMGGAQIGFDEAMQRLEKGNEPIIAATTMYEGHFIVLVSKSGDEITVNDPMPNGPDPYTITVGHLQGIDPSGAYFYVHP